MEGGKCGRKERKKKCGCIANKDGATKVSVNGIVGFHIWDGY